MAVYLPDHDILMIHNAKCGGTFAEFSMQAAGVNAKRQPTRGEKRSLDIHRHCTVDQYRRAYGHNPRLCFVFVRHPTTWYESWWRYQRGQWVDYGKHHRWHPQEELLQAKSDDFNTFVSNCLELCPQYVSRMYRLYTTDCQLVFKSEVMRTCLCGLLEREGVSFDQSRLMFHPKEHESDRTVLPSWDESLKQRVLEEERDALKIWESASVG